VTESPAPSPWPSEIRLHKADRILEVSFEDGAHFRFPAEFLRVESPSAEVKGHGRDTRITVPGKRRVAIAGIEPVGNYAIRILFDDRHDTGIFSWAYLHELGRDQAKIWQAYLDALAAQGLSRDP
jgi:DUF971 family protein